MELDELLEEHKEWLERDASAGVVRCRLSGHAMPLRAESVSQYIRRVVLPAARLAALLTLRRFISGKQFEKLRARAVELKALKQVRAARFCGCVRVLRSRAGLADSTSRTSCRPHTSGASVRTCLPLPSSDCDSAPATGSSAASPAASFT